ncbi:hypothetical protein OG205_26560 [Lentzea sp. NBC_00516]|nr:hypothetical protein [Lentzea sp. NBC_00516]WUD21679.1 hypothetical protein OG205_26560 [Lentzea sp. NBC_00516]
MRIFTWLGLTLLAVAALATGATSAEPDFTVANIYYVDGNQ